MDAIEPHKLSTTKLRAADALARAAAQPVLFGAPNRAALLKCTFPQGSRICTVAVHRNHAVASPTSAGHPAVRMLVGPPERNAVSRMLGDALRDLRLVHAPQRTIPLVGLAREFSLARDVRIGADVESQARLKASQVVFVGAGRDAQRVAVARSTQIVGADGIHGRSLPAKDAGNMRQRRERLARIGPCMHRRHGQPRCDRNELARVVIVVAQGALHVREAAVSCRALGRSIEDVMMTQALRLVAEGRDVQRVRFDIVQRPRNVPARNWLTRYARTQTDDATATVDVAIADLAGRVLPDAIAVAGESAEPAR